MHGYSCLLCRQLCLMGSLDPEKVRGKIVVCLRGTVMRVEKGEAVRHAGGAAMILVNDESTGNDLQADPHVLPAVHITHADGLALWAYIKSTKYVGQSLFSLQTLYKLYIALIDKLLCNVRVKHSVWVRRQGEDDLGHEAGAGHGGFLISGAQHGQP